MPFITPVIEDSPLNFVQFVDAEFAQNPSIHQLYPGQDWEEKTYAPGTTRQPYFYPAEMADPIPLQFHTSYNNIAPPTLRLFRVITQGAQQIGVPFYTFPTPQFFFQPGNNTILPNGNTEFLATYQWGGSWVQIPNIQPGIYYLVITLSYNKSGQLSPIDASHSKKSAHIELRWTHPKTVRMAALNNSNDYDTLFTPTGFKPICRFQGALFDFIPDSEDNSFTNQRQRVRKLFSRPNHTKRLVIGGGRGIPEWVKAWANYAMSCDYKAVDNIEITKDANSQWEQIEAFSTYPLGGQSMSVREADVTRRYTTIIPSYVSLFTRPNVVPYDVVRVGLRQGAGTPIVLGNNFLIRSKTDEERMLSRLQGEIVRLGLKGHVAFAGNELRYINHYSEQYDISASIALSRFIGLQYSPQYGATLTLSVQGTYLAVDWGDGKFDSYGNGSSTTFTATHTYVNLNPTNVKVFHGSNTMNTFSTSGSTGVGDVYGEIPSNLVEFQVANARLNGFNTPILYPAAGTLELLNLRNNQINTLVDFDFTLNRKSITFDALDEVLLNGNLLSVSYVDEVIDAVYQATQNSGINGGVLSLDQQTPPAPPSDIGPGSSYSNLTTTYGWTVLTD